MQFASAGERAGDRATRACSRLSICQRDRAENEEGWTGAGAATPRKLPHRSLVLDDNHPYAVGGFEILSELGFISD